MFLFRLYFSNISVDFDTIEWRFFQASFKHTTSNQKINEIPDQNAGKCVLVMTILHYAAFWSGIKLPVLSENFLLYAL